VFDVLRVVLVFFCPTQTLCGVDSLLDNNYVANQTIKSVNQSIKKERKKERKATAIARCNKDVHQK